MSTATQKKFEAGFFVIANIIAGVLHYLYQVVGVKRLDTTSFGQLTAWMAYAALGFSLGLLAQSMANFFPQSVKSLRWQGPATFFFALLLCWIAISMDLTPTHHAVIGILMFTLFGWMNGQCQTQKMFWVMGLLGLVVGVFKLGVVVFPESITLENFYWGYTLNSIIGLAVVMVVFLVRSKNTSKAQTQDVRLGFTAAAILAFITMFIPQFDVLFVAQTQPEAVTAEFAQVALVYRGIFFFILIFAQWLLPSQIQSGKSGLSSKDEKKRVFMAVGGGVLIAALASTLGPPVAKVILGIELGDHPIWIFLSTVHVSILTVLFLRIQRECAGLKVGSALLQSAIMVLVLTGMLILKPTVTVYLACVCAIHFMVLIGAVMAGGKVRT